MIADGYTFKADLGDGLFVAYRPMLREERRQLLDLQRRIGPESVWIILRDRLRDCDNAQLIENRVLDAFEKSPEEITLRLIGAISPRCDSPWTREWELETARNLKDGVILEMLHPAFARRDCTHCQTWWYDDEYGQIVKNAAGQNLLRPEGTVTLCQTESGCPKGTPENQKALSPMNKLAVRHFQMCDAINRFPNDEIVARNAGIIRAAMIEADAHRREQLATA